jgi:hypothetical protein
VSNDDGRTERFDNDRSGGEDGSADSLTAPRKSRTGWIVGGVLAAVVVVGGIVTASLLGASNSGGDAAGADAPSAVATETAQTPGTSQIPGPAASAQPTDNASGAVDQVAVPTDCEAIYTPQQWSELSNATDLPFNHPGVVSNERLTMYDDVNALLEANDKLACSWGGPSEYGIQTWVVEVTPGQSAEAVRALEANGSECGDQLGGIRCTQEFADDEDGTGVAGYSHVLRGNLWIATHWVNVAPENYSEGIVETLFS